MTYKILTKEEYEYYTRRRGVGLFHHEVDEDEGEAFADYEEEDED